MNLLLIRLSSMGDIVLTTPALKILQENYSDVKIDYLVYEKFSEILTMSKRIESLIVFPKKRLVGFLKRAKFIKSFLLLKRFFSKLRNIKYDFIIDLHNTTDSGLLSLLAKSKRRVGHKKQILNLCYYKRSNFEEKNESTKLHAYLINLLFLQDAGLINEHSNQVDNSIVPELQIPLENRRYADEFFASNDFLKGFVMGINPCGSYDFKRWSESGFASLADKLLAEKGGSLLLFAGPGEEAIVKRVMKKMKKPAVIVSGFKLLDVIAIISKLDLFVTNDSGLMHVATAFSVPLVAIFGPTNFLKFAPLGGNSRSVCSSAVAHSKRLRGLKKKTPGELFPGVSQNEILSAVNSLNI